MNGNHFDIHDLKREYEKGKKQGAVEEHDLYKVMFYRLTTEKFLDWLQNRTKELKGEQKHEY